MQIRVGGLRHASYTRAGNSKLPSSNHTNGLAHELGIDELPSQRQLKSMLSYYKSLLFGQRPTVASNVSSNKASTPLDIDSEIITGDSNIQALEDWHQMAAWVYPTRREEYRGLLNKAEELIRRKEAEDLSPEDLTSLNDCFAGLRRTINKDTTYSSGTIETIFSQPRDNALAKPYYLITSTRTARESGDTNQVSLRVHPILKPKVTNDVRNIPRALPMGLKKIGEINFEDIDFSTAASSGSMILKSIDPNDKHHEFPEPYINSITSYPTHSGLGLASILVTSLLESAIEDPLAPTVVTLRDSSSSNIHFPPVRSTIYKRLNFQYDTDQYDRSIGSYSVQAARTLGTQKIDPPTLDKYLLHEEKQIIKSNLPREIKSSLLDNCTAAEGIIRQVSEDWDTPVNGLNRALQMGRLAELVETVSDTRRQYAEIQSEYKQNLSNYSEENAVPLAAIGPASSLITYAPQSPSDVYVDLATSRVPYDLSGIGLTSVQGIDEEKINLSGRDLSNADLRSANLFGADLSSTNLSEANLAGADIRNANLSGANLNNAELLGANLDDAKLEEQDRRNSDIARFDLDELTAKDRISDLESSRAIDENAVSHQNSLGTEVEPLAKGEEKVNDNEGNAIPASDVKNTQDMSWTVGGDAPEQETDPMEVLEDWLDRLEQGPKTDIVEGMLDSLFEDVSADENRMLFAAMDAHMGAVRLRQQSAGDLGIPLPDLSMLTRQPWGDEGDYLPTFGTFQSPMSINSTTFYS